MRELVQLFKALSDQTRLRILNLLFKTGEMCVCDIQRVLDQSQPKISRHLAYLKYSGLVEDRREGQWIIYSLLSPQDPRRQALFNFLKMAFSQHQIFQEDLRTLEKCISEGRCVSVSVVKS